MANAVIKSSENIEAKCVNTIRALALDMVDKAKSGHQGTAMALAPLAHVLYTRVLKHDPSKPKTFNRDRLVLSAGHASALLYSALHLSGYEISLDDLKEFRQWDSLTPGHPELNHTPGVEVTTGPLGQGFANAVGMAIAEKNLQARFGKELIDHNIFAICGDGDLMEGVSYEAASIAGHNKLDNLVVIYDDNKITIDGTTELSFSDNVADRFRAQNWNVIEAGEISEDLDAIEAAINEAKVNTGSPTIIVMQTQCGFPSPKFTNSHKAHGNPFDADEIKATKEEMGHSTDSFSIDEDVYAFYKGAVSHQSEKLFDHALNAASLVKEGNEKAKELAQIISGDKTAIKELAKSDLANYFAEAPKVGDQIATRVACASVLSKIAEVTPSMIGGSADLTGNTGTLINSFEGFSPSNYSGRQLYFGIREHAMSAIAVGMSAGYGLMSFTGTFFVFSDYMKPSIRLAALNNLPVLFVFSHDSIGVGEDGPTHQPIEHLAALRAMPGVNVVRPCDAYETAAAIENHFLNADGPTVLITSRQNLPVLEGTHEKARKTINSGAEVLRDGSYVTLVGTGSEVHLCVEAADILENDHGVKASVVSLSSLNKFSKLSGDEQADILGDYIAPIITVEAGSTFGWSAISENNIGIDRFGASAPAGTIYEKLNVSMEEIVKRSLAAIDFQKKNQSK